MKNYAELTMKQFETLQHLTNQDDIQLVRNRIVELNIKLVSQVLKKYKPYSEDQFQNGCIGLIIAANTYQPTRNVPFSSYACFCIERELHAAHKKLMEEIEGKVSGDKWLYLDAQSKLPGGDTIDNYDIVFDENAENELMAYIEENEMTFICDHIIKPCIQEIADKGRHMQSKVNFDEWSRWEFLYIMDLLTIDSQKQRFNLTQLAKKLGISVQNTRVRHEKVMDMIFQRMWFYMTLRFNDLFERLRGNCKVPERLLVFDPGKTTGWALFEKGKLTRTGHIENCFDDNNIDATGLLSLMEDIKPDFILYEDYKVYAHKLERHSFNPVFTLRLIGVIETYCQMNKVASHKQMATTAKNFCTDEKLKSWGFWQTGMRHARDAIRHGCYFLLFYKKGEDIV